MKKVFLRILYTIVHWGFIRSVLVSVFEIEAAITRKLAAWAHWHQFIVQWGKQPNPEFFDHTIDYYFQFPIKRTTFWIERGVFGNLALFDNGSVLELSCGDGFNTRHFYSPRSLTVVACDYNKNALRIAMKKNNSSNIKYVLADIRTQMPEGLFDTVVWDGALEHFSEVEIKSVLNNCVTRLTPRGIMTGHTLIEQPKGGKIFEHHETVFKNKKDLASLISPYFKNVSVFETVHPGRHNLYFWASNGVVPFSPTWPAAVHIISNNS